MCEVCEVDFEALLDQPLTWRVEPYCHVLVDLGDKCSKNARTSFETKNICFLDLTWLSAKQGVSFFLTLGIIGCWCASNSAGHFCH